MSLYILLLSPLIRLLVHEKNLRGAMTQALHYGKLSFLQCWWRGILGGIPGGSWGIRVIFGGS